MDDEDDMIVIIVGDENEKSQSCSQTTKDDNEDDSDDKYKDTDLILETAEMHGQYISLSEEPVEYFDCEYLDDYFVSKDDQESEIKYETIKKKKRKNHLNDGCKTKKITNKRRPKPELSYIAQLRKNFPKMKKDEDFLLAHLAELMKHCKPPTPPLDFYYDINGRFECAYCHIISDTMNQASRHYQKKHGTRYLICYACGADFKCTTGLYKHEIRCLSADAKLVLKARGRYLGRKGKRRPYLTQNTFQPPHLQNKKVKAVKSRHCALCNVSFKQKEAFQAHINMHQGVKPYQCDRCPAAYAAGIGLKRHMARKHTDIEYICDVCGRSFKAKITLVVHMDTHLPQRKYGCDLCDRRYAQKSALSAHIDRDHLNIPPPLCCTACPKRFPRMSNLKAHMKARHKLTLMTRKMFYKALPGMNKEELKRATVVFNTAENKVVTAPLRESVFDEAGELIQIDGIISLNENDDGDEETNCSNADNSDDPKDVQVFVEAKQKEDNETDVNKSAPEQENVDKNPKEGLCTHSNIIDCVEIETEENLSIPNNAVVQTLEETSELEFVEFGARVDEGSYYKIETTIVEDNDEDIQAEPIDTIVENTIETKQESKKVNEKLKKINNIRRTIETRSSVMKTRSKAIRR